MTLEPLSHWHRPSHPGQPAYNRCVECSERWPCDAIHLIALERAFDRMHLFNGKGKSR